MSFSFKIEQYPKIIDSVLCQCGGELVAECTEHGNLADEHKVYRVHCKWCPMSSRWLTHEYDCLEEIINGMGLRRKSINKATVKKP